MKLPVVCLIIAILFFSVARAEQGSIPVYSYHTDPPFYIPDQPIDLTRAWVAKFNRHHKNIQLNLIQITRPKLNSIVKSGKPYLILWANAIWFKRLDANIVETDSIFWDADIWVSKPSKALRYAEPKDVIGKIFGGRKGYFYKGLSELIQTGKVTRIDKDTDHDNYDALKAGKIDAFVMSRSSLLYWFSTGIEPRDLYIAGSPHDAYTRHVLASADLAHIVNTLNQYIHGLRSDSGWQKRLSMWGVAKLLDPFELDLNELDSLQ